MKEIRKTNVRIRKEYKVFKCDISFTRNVYILWIRRTTSIGKMNKQRSHSCNIRKCINQAQLLFRISSQNKYLILLHESYKLWIFFVLYMLNFFSSSAECSGVSFVWVFHCKCLNSIWNCLCKLQLLAHIYFMNDMMDFFRKLSSLPINEVCAAVHG